MNLFCMSFRKNNDDDGDDDDNVNHEGEISDTNHRLQFPATTSTNQSYPIITKTIVNILFNHKSRNEVNLNRCIMDEI